MTTTPVPGYVLHDVVGRGTTSQVWRGEPVGAPGRVVAVKRLTVTDPSAVAALQREAEALTRLSHPHVLRVLDVVPDGDGIALVTPLATGGSLDRRLTRSPDGLPAVEVADLGARLARGLAAAHDAGFVHGDVKPPNVLFDAEGQPLLADLGLATVRGRPTSVAGSAGYLDPAVAVDGRPPDVAADLYALGATLHEALCGHPPFTGDDAEAILAAAAAGEAPAVASRAAVPAALAAAVDRALARDPDARHPSAHALAGELDEVARLLAAGAIDVPDGPPPPPHDRSPERDGVDGQGGPTGQGGVGGVGGDGSASHGPDRGPAPAAPGADTPHGTRAFAPGTPAASAASTPHPAVPDPRPPDPRPQDGSPQPGPPGRRAAGVLGAAADPPRRRLTGRRVRAARPDGAPAVPPAPGPPNVPASGRPVGPLGADATGPDPAHRPGPRPGRPSDTRAFGPVPPPRPTSTSGAREARGVDRRLLLAAAALAVVIPVGLVTWLVLGSDDDPAPLVAEAGTDDGAGTDPEPGDQDAGNQDAGDQDDAAATASERAPAPLCEGVDAEVVGPGDVQVQLGDLAGRGCSVPVVWDGSELVVDVPGAEAERYELQADGDDLLLLGDLTCEGRDVPALYRPTTGQLFVFTSLAGADEELTADTRDTGVVDGAPRVLRGEGGCDTVEVLPR